MDFDRIKSEITPTPSDQIEMLIWSDLIGAKCAHMTQSQQARQLIWLLKVSVVPDIDTTCLAGLLFTIHFTDNAARTHFGSRSDSILQHAAVCSEQEVVT